MPSIELNPETVFSVIDLVRDFQVGVGSSDDDESVNLMAAESIEVSHAVTDPILAELETGIDDLEPDQQVTLVALMWLGRGDFETSQWYEALDLAGQQWTNHTGDYLAGTPLLADYLEEAMNQLGYVRD